MKHIGAAVAITAIACLLTGCGSNGFKIISQQRGLPPGGEVNPTAADFKPQIYWTDASQSTATLLTYGSSSCPSIPETLQLNGSRDFTLVMKQYGGACTADLGPHVTEFTVPKETSRTDEVAVTLDFLPQSLDDEAHLRLQASSILMR